MGICQSITSEILLITILKYMFCKELIVSKESVIINIVLTIFAYLFDYTWIGYIFAAILFLFNLIYSFKKEFYKYLSCQICTVLLVALIPASVEFIGSTVNIHVIGKNNTFGIMIIIIIEIGLIFYLYKQFIKKKIYISFSRLERVLISIYCLLFLVGGMSLQGIQPKLLSNSIDAVHSVYSLIPYLIVGLNFFIILYIVKKKIVEFYEKTKAINDGYMEMQLKYFQYYKTCEEETRRFRHDVKNNLLCLNSLMSESKYQEAKDYLDMLTGQIEKLSKNIFTGDDIIDSIITCKLSNIDKNNIKFTHDGVFDRPLNLKPIDICTIFANAFDNAIEACNNIKHKERSIYLSIKRTSHFYIIQIENTISSNETLDVRNLATKKENKMLHGFGLENIKRTVEKYHGHVEIKIENNRFILNIIL